MDKLDKIVNIIRSLKEDAGMVTTSGITNSANKAGLGFDPNTESPPVSKSLKLLRRNSPKFAQNK